MNRSDRKTRSPKNVKVEGRNLFFFTPWIPARLYSGDVTGRRKTSEEKKEKQKTFSLMKLEKLERFWKKLKKDEEKEVQQQCNTTSTHQ